MISVVSAGVTAVLSIVFYIFPPKNESHLPALSVFLLFALTVAFLVVETGGLSSPFIALWMIAAIFSGLFGIYGVLPLLAAVGIFLGATYLAHDFTIQTVTTVALVGITPLLASSAIWHGRNDKKAGEHLNYKDLANELTEVATKSEVVINAIGDGVIAIDTLGNIQLINPAAQRILGWGKQDSMGLNYKSVLKLMNQQNEELDTLNDPVQQVLNSNQEIRTDDYNLVTKNGRKIASYVSASPIGDAGSGVIIIFRDITKEKAEEREQAEFISTASHEMRTPVASIEGYLGLALNPSTAAIDEKARDYISKAQQSAQHLGHLFQDLLDVSKAEDGRLSNNPKVVNLTDYVHDIVQGLLPQAEEKGLRLIYKPIPDNNQHIVAPVFYTNADNDHIREIVNNLVENAIKYTPAGEVTIDLSATEERVVICVKDSGIGIPVEDIPHLFQKFYRVDNEDTRQIGGTGLGLYLSRRLAEAMGGRIWLESEYKKGSTFYLELPRISTQDAERLKAEQTQKVIQTPPSVAAPVPAVAPTPITIQSAQPAPPVAPPTNTPASPTPPPVVPSPPLERSSVRPATTVPRGQSLTPEQIAAHVARLEEMARQQQAAPANNPPGQP
ncbi:MAG: putative sensor protein [Candidatus Saccharibacteria bacterium]|nr:putative sensor protein [Candidatus Saccharibacteria bacterium]